MTREGADPSSAHGETPARVDLALEHREMPARADAASEHRETPVVPYAVTIVAHHVGSVGGMERIITELALGLRRRGHAVTVIAYACELPADAGVTFHRVRGPSRPFVLSYPWFMLFGTLAVRRWRRGVVQATGAIVLNRVDFIEIQYCQQVGPATPSRSSLPFRLNAKVAGLLGRVAERVCFRVNRAWRFVCASEGTAEEIRRYFPQLAERVVTVQNGVDIDAFAPDSRGADARALRAQLQLDGGRLVAIFVGSEWDRKGLEPALRALAGADAWDLVVVGAGDRPRYEAICWSSAMATASATGSSPATPTSSGRCTGSASRAMSRRSISSPTRSCSLRAMRPSRWSRSRPPRAVCRSSRHRSTVCASSCGRARTGS
jgi:hypothetical protein